MWKFDIFATKIPTIPCYLIYCDVTFLEFAFFHLHTHFTNEDGKKNFKKNDDRITNNTEELELLRRKIQFLHY